MTNKFKFNPAIKWSGSKRSQAHNIIEQIPDRKFETYYEPFCGGASMMFSLIHSGVEVERYVCSDINNDLISFWNLLKSDYTELIEHYTVLWEELNKDEDKERRKEFFNIIRKRLNEEHDPRDFLFIMRTTTNGMPRYNKKGEFNNSFHVSRGGIIPKNLEKDLKLWSEALNKHNVEFLHRDFREITTSKNDLVYLDPPYANTKGMYFGTIDTLDITDWVIKQDATILMSYDGKSNSIDNTVDVDGFDKHIYLESGNSSFSRLFTENKKNNVKESLYLRDFR